MSLPKWASSRTTELEMAALAMVALGMLSLGAAIATLIVLFGLRKDAIQVGY